MAGASGAVGKPLIRQLVEAGHETFGTTRREEKAQEIEAAGATPAVCDALDSEALRAAVVTAKPDVVVNQLTSLPKRFNPRTIDYEEHNRARLDGGRNLLEAAKAAGTRRYVTQSLGFIYDTQGDWIKEEGDPTMQHPPKRFTPALEATLGHEREILSADGVEGLVLRYGQFYGPGTYYAADGSIAEDVRKRRFPIVGRGTGYSSFTHVEDAAAAVVAALGRGSAGIYNVVDDEPAPLKEWLPFYAEQLGAKPPRRVPVWLARIVAGPIATMFAVGLRGASNRKAKAELGWAPRYPSWRQGFGEALG